MTELQEQLFEVPEEWWVRRRCQVCGGALSVRCTHTYAVQRQGWVKIGATSDPRRRINELRRPAWRKHILSPAGMDWLEPLVTLGLIVGDVEHELHPRFAELHVFGEWFRPAGEMLNWLAALTASGD
jgi:hypothetical protein